MASIGPENPTPTVIVEAHFEDLEEVWDDRYALKYGFWRPYVMDVIYRYLNGGDLYFDFPGLNAETADMNICFRFPANAFIFTRRVIRNMLWKNG